MTVPKFHGQWTPPTDEVLYRNYFRHKRHGYFIDVGAGDGVYDSNTLFFEKSLGWRGVCLEPSPSNFDKLVKVRRSMNIMAGLSDRTASRVKFTEANDGVRMSGGAIDYPPKLREFVLRCGFRFRELEIDTLSYGSLIQSVGVKTVDLMSVDVEGEETAVLQGMKRAQPETLPAVVCIEYTVVGLEIIKRCLEGMGYRFDFVSNNNAFFSRAFGATALMESDFVTEGQS